MTNTHLNNRRIARNTIILYMRMALSMLVSLFTSRIVLQQLGEVDYGVYNVVAGVIVIFSFLTGTLSSSSSRFISYDIGKGDELAIQSTFSTLLFIVFCFSLIAFFLSESIGLWYVIHILKYPVDIHKTVLTIYQISVVGMLFSIWAIPFTSMIIACERMAIYAYITLFDVFSKLGIAIILIYVHDKLIYFALMQGCISCLLLLLYFFYCKKTKLITSLSFRPNKERINAVLKYSSWTFFGGVANIASTQGINLLLNYVFGVILNTAYGLTMQVQNAIRSFSISFQMALNPQLIKTYSSNDIENHHSLIVKSIKFSFFLIILIAYPIYFNIEPLMRVWLGSYPSQTISFIKWILFSIIIIAIANPLGVSVEASGKIGRMTFYSSLILIIVVPLSWIILKFNLNPDIPFVIKLLAQFVCLIIKVYYAKKTCALSITWLIKNSFIPVLLVGIISFTLCYIFCEFFDTTLWGTCLRIVLCVITVIVSSYICGMNKHERLWINSIIMKRTKL